MEIIIIILLITLFGSLVFGYQQFYSVKSIQETFEKLKESEAKANEKLILKDNELEQQRLKLVQQQQHLDQQERKLLERDKILDDRFDKLLKKEKNVEDRINYIDQKEKSIDLKLEKISQLTKEEAQKLLQESVKEELSTWISKKIREAENQISSQVDEKAKQMLIETMLNAATDYVAETTCTTLTITDENLKGKLIGKEGRNIRTFERLTGVDLIIDELPNQVTVSSFDPIRREVAALAIKKLLSDGRVHPGAIEETIEKVKKDVLKEIKKTGEEMAFDAGINNLPQEIIMLLGRFKYRFSYGQNLVKHTLEMVKIGEILSTELKANARIVKLACLLHDIGKVVPEEGKQHHHISAEIARKYFPKDEVLANAIEAHHFDIEAKSVEAEIVRLADAISGARPGARRDNYEEYIKRVRALEDISNKQKGVKESFAIHAGREIRVIVKPEETTDEDASIIAYNVAKEIENTQSYPGVIKVSVIREVRVTKEAR